jgi:hypothetical protein
MITNFHPGSAKIYQFPVRARTTSASNREQTKSSAEFTSPQITETTFGSGWYHEAAIQEAEQLRKR